MVGVAPEVITVGADHAASNKITRTHTTLSKRPAGTVLESFAVATARAVTAAKLHKERRFERVSSARRGCANEA
eukprot:2781676-Prymnesium_polylepis.1